MSYYPKPKREYIDELRDIYLTYGTKRRTSEAYAEQLLSFCELTSNASVGLKVLPDSLLAMTIDEIEDMAEEHVRRFKDYRASDIRGRLYDDIKISLLRQGLSQTRDEKYLQNYKVAPKRLNVQLSALKLWLLINKKIKNRKMFRELKFEKGRAVEQSLMVSTLETADVQKMFQIANGVDSIILGLYGLCGIRPSIIPQIQVKHIHPRSAKIVDGKLQWTRSPPLIIVPAEMMGEHVDGNKASIMFPVFIPNQIAARILNYVNEGTVTPETRLSPADKKSAIDYVVKKYYVKVGFSGKPYRLRNFASRVLKIIETKYNDAEFKEFLLGHKPAKISFTYDFKGLSEDMEADWRGKYAIVDKWINESIFNVASSEDMKAARMLTELAAKLGDEAKAREIFAMFEKGNMTMEMLEQRLAGMIKTEQEKQLGMKIEQYLSKQYPKGLPVPEAKE